METGFFTNMANFVWDGVLRNLLESSLAQARVQMLINCLSAAIAIYIIYKGYMMLAGRSQEPVKELLWDCVAKILIIAILKNADGLYDLVISFINALEDWADGSGQNTDSFSYMTMTLDGSLGLMNKINLPLFEKTNIVLWPFLCVLGWISILFATCFTFFVYITTKITLTLLIFLAPVFIYCRLFGFLKNMFQQWVQLVLANILTLLIISLISGYGFRLIQKIIEDYCKLYEANASPNSAQAIAYLFCACLMQVVIIKIGVKIAEQTTSVSLEAAGMSAVAGAAGMAAGGAGFAASKFGAPAAKLGIGALGGIGKFADNKITKGAFQSAGKALSNKFNEYKGRISNFINKARGGG